MSRKSRENASDNRERNSILKGEVFGYRHTRGHDSDFADTLWNALWAEESLEQRDQYPPAGHDYPSR